MGGGGLSEGMVLDLVCWPCVEEVGGVAKFRDSLRGANKEDLLLPAVEKSPAKGRFRGVWASTGSEEEKNMCGFKENYEGVTVRTPKTLKPVGYNANVTENEFGHMSGRIYLLDPLSK